MQNWGLDPTGLANNGESRRLMGTGPSLDQQEAVGQVFGRFRNPTELFFRSKPGPLPAYQDPLLTLHPAKGIHWASWRGLQFDTARMEVALITRLWGHTKHLRPKLTAKTRVGSGFIRLNTQVTCWLGVWMDADLTFKEQHNRCMKNARAAEARLGTLTMTFSIDLECEKAVQVACVQAVAQCGSELWCDPKEVGEWDNLQLPLNRQARSILGAPTTTPRCALLRESGLTPAPEIWDSRQLQFTARLSDACGSMLKELHHNLSCRAPICRVVKRDDGHGRTPEAMKWPATGEWSVVRTTILDDTTAATRTAQHWAREKDARIRAWV